jgi:hypothetical protein
MSHLSWSFAVRQLIPGDETEGSCRPFTRFKGRLGRSRRAIRTRGHRGWVLASVGGRGVI